MNKLNIDEIRKAREANKETRENRLKRRHRLYLLVKNYGYDAVSAASGWKVSTISQYLRNNNPTISELKLSEAERILKSI